MLPSPLSFIRGQGFHGQGMDGAGKLFAQNIVDHTLASYTAEAFKLIANDAEPEMRLAPFPCPRMPRMEMRFIDHLDP